MKTLTAFLAHAGIGALQAVAAQPALNGDHSGIGGIAAQIGIQGALLALQAIVATQNSNTAPNGKPLVEIRPGKFVTTPE